MKRGYHSFIGGFESIKFKKWLVKTEFKDAVTALYWSRDKEYVAVGSAKGALQVYELESMGVISTVQKAIKVRFSLKYYYSSKKGAIKCISWSHDGNFLVTGSQDCSLMLYSPKAQKNHSQLHQCKILI